MTFGAYLLRCADGTYCAGHTDDLEHRYGQHCCGATGGYTFSRRPVTLAWSGGFGTRLEALDFERRIKGWTRAKKEALIAGDWAEVARPARGRPSTSSGLTESRDGR